MDEMPSPTKEAPPAGSAPQSANPLVAGKPLPAGKQHANRRRWLIRGSLVILLLAVVVLVGVPWISQVLSTVSTDDAYVNGYVTFVAPRVLGQVRALESQARSYRWALQHAIEQVDNQVAMLRANVATLQSQEASLELAQADFDRDQKLIVTNAIWIRPT